MKDNIGVSFDSWQKCRYYSLMRSVQAACGAVLFYYLLGNGDFFLGHKTVGT